MVANKNRGHKNYWEKAYEGFKLSSSSPLLSQVVGVPFSVQELYGTKLSGEKLAKVSHYE